MAVFHIDDPVAAQAAGPAILTHGKLHSRALSDLKCLLSYKDMHWFGQGHKELSCTPSVKKNCYELEFC